MSPIRVVPADVGIKKQKPAARRVQAICGKVKRSKLRRPTRFEEIYQFTWVRKRMVGLTGINGEQSGESKQEVDGTKPKGRVQSLSSGITCVDEDGR